MTEWNKMDQNLKHRGAFRGRGHYSSGNFRGRTNFYRHNNISPTRNSPSTSMNHPPPQSTGGHGIVSPPKPNLPPFKQDGLIPYPPPGVPRFPHYMRGCPRDRGPGHSPFIGNQHRPMSPNNNYPRLPYPTQLPPPPPPPRHHFSKCPINRDKVAKKPDSKSSNTSSTTSLSEGDSSFKSDEPTWDFPIGEETLKKSSIFDREFLRKLQHIQIPPEKCEEHSFELYSCPIIGQSCYRCSSCSLPRCDDLDCADCLMFIEKKKKPQINGYENPRGQTWHKAPLQNPFAHPPPPMPEYVPGPNRTPTSPTRNNKPNPSSPSTSSTSLSSSKSSFTASKSLSSTTSLESKTSELKTMVKMPQEEQKVGKNCSPTKEKPVLDEPDVIRRTATTQWNKQPNNKGPREKAGYLSHCDIELIETLPLDIPFMGVIPYSISPSEIYIMKEASFVQFLKMMEIERNFKALTHTPPIKNADLKVGKYCFARYEDKWYRGKILGVEDCNVEILYLDYGEVCNISKADIRELPEPFYEIKTLISRMKLYNVKPCNGQTDWSAECKEFFLSISERIKCRCRVRYRDNYDYEAKDKQTSEVSPSRSSSSFVSPSNCVGSIELKAPDSDWEDLGDYLVKLGHAEHLTDEEIQCNIKRGEWGILLDEDKCFNFEPILKLGKKTKITRIVKENGLDDFYITTPKDKARLNRMNEIIEEYDTFLKRRRLDGNFNSGPLCLAPIKLANGHQKLVRANVEIILDEEKVELYYVDLGQYRVESIAKLYSPPHTLHSEPPTIHRCQLARVKPREESVGWPSELRKELGSFISSDSNSLDIVAFDYSDGVYLVDLYQNGKSWTWGLINDGRVLQTDEGVIVEELLEDEDEETGQEVSKDIKKSQESLETQEEKSEDEEISGDDNDQYDTFSDSSEADGVVDLKGLKRRQMEIKAQSNL